MRRFRMALATVLAALLSFFAFAGPCMAEEMIGGAPASSDLAEAEHDIMAIQAESYEQPVSRETFCNLVVTLFAERKGSTVDALYGKLTEHQKKESFQDIQEDDKYISLAKKYELMKGTGSLNFAPSTAITRAEIACILYNLTKGLAPERVEFEEQNRGTLEIEDQVELAEWSRDAVEFCVGAELLELDQHGNFDPTATMTVADAMLLVSDTRTFLDTPVPERKAGIPMLVWYTAGGCLAVGALTALIIVLLRRSKRKARDKAEKERRQEAELDRLLAPSAAGAAAAPKKDPDQEGRPGQGVLTDEEEETVYLRTKQPPKVRITGAESTDKVFSLFTPVTMGRSNECVLQMKDSTISRNHCRIVWRGHAVLLEDTGARNPVNVVRGASTFPVSKGEGFALCTGDTICIGSSELVITILDD